MLEIGYYLKSQNFKQIITTFNIFTYIRKNNGLDLYAIQPSDTIIAICCKNSKLNYSTHFQKDNEFP